MNKGKGNKFQGIRIRPDIKNILFSLPAYHSMKFFRLSCFSHRNLNLQAEQQARECKTIFSLHFFMFDVFFIQKKMKKILSSLSGTKKLFYLIFNFFFSLSNEKVLQL